jgi:hypothetical protein
LLLTTAVPSFLHEFLVDLFRERPALAGDLLRMCASVELGAGRVERGSIDLSQVVSTEYRADTVAVVRDDAQVAIGAAIVEIQLRVDPDKLRTWPVYVTALRAVLGCPATLLVLAPDTAVARWARTAIPIGHPRFQLEPVVVTYADIPRLTAPATSPELAVLSALAHRDVDAATIAVATLRELPEDKQRLYWDVVMSALPAAARELLEAHMQGYEYQTEFARKYFAQGREEGREEGRERLREMVVALARAKLGELASEDEERIQRCDDDGLATLGVALGRAVDAEAAREVLRALKRP